MKRFLRFKGVDGAPVGVDADCVACVHEDFHIARSTDQPIIGAKIHLTTGPSIFVTASVVEVLDEAESIELRVSD